MPTDPSLYGDAAIDSDPYTQQLLKTAQEQGGAVAQAAAETVHPNGGFLSMVRDKLGNAFHGVMDMLATPEETIASGMSMFSQHPHSLADAYKNHIQPSEVLFGTGEAKSAIGKAGMFGVKLLTDSLLDPLTYATFGEYSGLFGLSKLPSIPIGPNVAKEMGWGKMVETAGGPEALRHHALSPEGLLTQKALTTRAEETLKNDTLERAGFGAPGSAAKGAGIELSTPLEGTGERFISADNIRGRVTRSLTNLIGKSPEDIAAAMTNPLSSGAELMASRNLLSFIAEAGAGTLAAEGAEAGSVVGPEGTLIGGLVGGGVGLAVKAIKDMTPIEKDAWTHAVNLSTAKAIDDQAARLVRHTLQAKRSDIDLAVQQQMKQLLERNAASGGKVVDKFGKPVVDQFGNTMVKNLAQAYLDKGGFKMFNQSVISGARIRQSMSLIKPAADSATNWSPKATKTLAALDQSRNYLSTLFSTNWRSTGRVADTMLQMMRTAKFKQEAQVNDFINTTQKAMQRFGVNPDELNLAMNAAVLNKLPANNTDERMQILFSLFHSQAGNQLMKDVASGSYGNDVKKIWQAGRFVQRQLNQNLVMMRDAGMPVFEQTNYLPLLLNEPKQVVSPFLTTKSAEAANATKGELNKWVNVKDPGKVLFGTQGAARDNEGNVHNLEQYTKAEEKSRIDNQIQNTVVKSEQKKADVSKQIEELWQDISEKHTKSIMSGAKEVIGEATEDRTNRKALEQVIRESIPQVDRTKILENYAKTFYKNGAKLAGETKTLSAEDVVKLKSDLATGDQDLDKVASYITSHLDEFGIKVGKEVGPTGEKLTSTEKNYQSKLKELMAVVKETGTNGKVEYLKNALSQPNDEGKTLSNVLQGLSEEWHKNPGAISRTMEGILNKSDDLRSTLEDLSDTKRGLQEELKGPGLKQIGKDRWYYQDSEGETYKRMRATAQEINDNLFDGKEMFSTSAFRSMFHATENTLRTVNTKALLMDVAEKFGVPADQAPSNYLKVSIAGMSQAKGDLADVVSKAPGYIGKTELVYHPSVAEAIVDMMKVMDKDPAQGALLSSFDHMTNVFKTSVTSIWPAFFGRNAISNVWQSMMDIGHLALNPANHMMAAQLQLNSHALENLAADLAERSTPEAFQKYMEMANKVILKDDRGYEWTVGELDRVIRDNVVAFNPSVLGMMDAGLTSSERMHELEDALFAKTDKWGTAIKQHYNPFKQSFGPFVVGRNLANWTESEPRILNFLANLKNSGDVSFAAHQTKQFLYDHANLTPFERNFLRRIIPFYSYTRKNMEGMVQTLIHKPGRTDLFRNVYMNVGDVMAGGNLSDQERSMLPAWMRDGLDIVTKRNGENVNILKTMGAPFEAPFDELGNLFGGINPLIKGPIEQATGYSFFEGKPLSQITDATAFVHAPKAVKDLIGFTTKQYVDRHGVTHTQYISMSPKMMNIFQNIPFTSRIASTLALLQNPNVETQNKVLANLFGIKPTTVDLESEEFQRQKELDKQLEQILSSAGVGYQRTEYTAPIGTHLPSPPQNPENQ
jgi:hypothetical protein